MTSPSLPPGFRFFPTDEELIVHYLSKRASSLPLPVSIIAEVDIYKFDPWDLPGNPSNNLTPTNSIHKTLSLSTYIFSHDLLDQPKPFSAIENGISSPQETGNTPTVSGQTELPSPATGKPPVPTNKSTQTQTRKT